MTSSNKLFLADAHFGIMRLQDLMIKNGIIEDSNRRRRKMEYVDPDTKEPGFIFFESFSSSSWKRTIQGRKFSEIAIFTNSLQELTEKQPYFSIDEIHSLISRLSNEKHLEIYSRFSRMCAPEAGGRKEHLFPVWGLGSIAREFYLPITSWRKGMELYFADIMNPKEEEIQLAEMMNSKIEREPTKWWESWRKE